MNVVAYDPTHAVGWDRLVGETPDACPGHDRRWPGVFARAFGHEPCSLVAIDGADVRGVLPLVEIRSVIVRRMLVSLPWLDTAGVCARPGDDAARAALIAASAELARARGARSLEIRAAREETGAGAEYAQKVTLTLSLEGGEDALWRRFDAKLRNQVRKAQKSGLTTEFGGVELLRDFYEPFSRNMRDLGVPVWGIGLYAEILRAFPNEAELLIVRHGTQAVGGALLFHWGRVLLVPCASSLREHFDKCPNHALYWSAMRRGLARGCTLLDFGRSTAGTGTHRFKETWGTTATACHWYRPLERTERGQTWSTTNPKMRLFVSTWRRLPIHVTRLVGPQITRRLPS